VAILERVGALLDNATMQELNRQFEVEKKEPRQVAAQFLKAKGVLR
jgi:osmoprotectant transport system substrate-binding protein